MKQQNALKWALWGAFALIITSMSVRLSGAAPEEKAPLQPLLTAMKAPAGKEVATFAAGCFWSVEHIYNQLKGVEKAEPGYAGGFVADPGYERVSDDNTGHAETVNIVFDPKVISYRELLKVLFTIHDPTTLNRQGADVGKHYRSAIFTHSKEQQQTAFAVIKELDDQYEWKNPIVTQVEDFTNFYRAEDYHLNYYSLHSNEPYCRYIIAPKVEKFRAKFADKLKK